MSSTLTKNIFCNYNFRNFRIIRWKLFFVIMKKYFCHFFFAFVIGIFSQEQEYFFRIFWWFFFIVFFRKYEKHFSTKNLKITEIVITENIFCQSAWHVLKLKSHDKMCAILKKYLLTLETTQEILVTDGGKPDVPFFAVFWGAVSVLFFLWFGRWFQWINSPLRFD